MKFINSLIVTSCIISSLIAENIYLDKYNPDSLRFKTAYATRCIEPPSVDGRLDDESWGKANSKFKINLK